MSSKVRERDGHAFCRDIYSSDWTWAWHFVGSTWAPLWHCFRKSVFSIKQLQHKQQKQTKTNTKTSPNFQKNTCRFCVEHGGADGRWRISRSWSKSVSIFRKCSFMKSIATTSFPVIGNVAGLRLTLRIQAFCSIMNFLSNGFAWHIYQPNN